jgi:hypothetical protein
MTQLDFAVAFLLIITILTYSVVSVSSKLTNDFNTFTVKRLDESASSLSKQLFEINDNKSLISSFKKISASFQEIGSYPHTETINIAITPVVENIHVYDNFLNEIDSTVNNGDNSTVSFNLSLSANEKRYANIFYEGISTSIAYLDNTTEINISALILSEEEAPVLSQQKCSELKALNHEAARNRFGFLDNFNITECDYGLGAPETANIIVKSIPLLIERSDGTIYSGFVKLRVW